MGVRKSSNANNQQHRFGGRHDSGAQMLTPSSSPDGFVNFARPAGSVREWVEIWDYAGDCRFRGFVAEKDGTRALFIFFDSSVIGKDLKQG